LVLTLQQFLFERNIRDLAGRGVNLVERPGLYAVWAALNIPLRGSTRAALFAVSTRLRFGVFLPSRLAAEVVSRAVEREAAVVCRRGTGGVGNGGTSVS
jgi:hypothetical protein